MGLVTTSPLVKRYTLEEFWELEPPGRGGHYELIAGVLYMVPPPVEWHDMVVSCLIELLVAFLLSHPGLGRAFVPRAAIWREAHHSYLEPDLMFVSEETQVRIRGGARSTADLVFEVLSEATATYDRLTKADTYAALGIRELWLVDLRTHTIEQRVLEGERWRIVGTFGAGQTVRSQVLPSFEVSVSAVFEGIPRQ